MLIDGFVEVYKKDDIVVIERKKVNLNLRKLVEIGLGSSEVLGEDLYLYKSFDENGMKSKVISPYRKRYRSYSIGGENERLEFFKIPLKMKGKTKIIDGLIIYKDEGKVANFLIKHINLNVPTEVTEFLNSCTNSYNKVDENVIYEKLKNFDSNYSLEKPEFLQKKSSFYNEIMQFNKKNNEKVYLLKKIL